MKEGLLPLGGLMALDWGQKRVGVATLDELGMLVTPQKSVERKRVPKLEVWKLLSDDRVWLRKLVDHHSPGGIVLGLPTLSDGSEGPAGVGARNLARDLEVALEIPVVLVDEHLSSWESRHHANVDSQSAGLLLKEIQQKLAQGLAWDD